MSWKDKDPEKWNDAEFNEAGQWVLDKLALDSGYQGIVEDLLGTWAPEEITHEHVEAMRDLR